MPVDADKLLVTRSLPEHDRPGGAGMRPTQPDGGSFGGGPSGGADDSALRGDIVRLLHKVTDEFRLATVMVTHYTEFVPLTDAVAVMRDGRISALQPPSSVPSRASS
jgi:hypothetical protein